MVATKTVARDLKVTAGVGWGRLGGSPANRPALTVPGGQLQDHTYFRGDAELFGGIEWITPIEGLSFKAEYSPDTYPTEVAGGFERDSDVNFGLSYRPNKLVEIGAQYLYGSTLGVNVTFRGNPMDPLTPQDLGSGPVPVRARADDAGRSTGWARQGAVREQVIEALSDALAAEGIFIQEARLTGTEIELYINNTLIQREPKAIGRVARILATAMPPSVETFRITPMSGPLPTTTAIIRRSDVEAQVDRPNAGARSWETTELEDAAPHIAGEDVWMPTSGRRFAWSLNPSLPTNLFDTDDGVRPDVQINASARFRIAPGLSVGGSVGRFVVGTDQQQPMPIMQALPVVRSDSGLYFSGRDIKLKRLDAAYVFKLAPEYYGRVTAGLLERMYGGVSGEILWAPHDSEIALGAEVNYARKRDWDDDFGFLDYDIVTGHASVYWDTGYKGLALQVDAGRYLAGDWGATVSLERRFANGWNVRGYMTRTEASFAEFGEGSFAKGFEVTMPLRWGLPFESKSTGTLSLATFERDGGARLNVQGRLHDRVQDYDEASLRQNWGSFWQ